MHAVFVAQTMLLYVWYKYVRLQERKFYQQFEALPLSAGAGSLFLWDSRTAHQNVMPGEVVPVFAAI